MIIALSDDKGKEILYKAMTNLWRKEIFEQDSNCLVGTIQKMSDFFKTQAEILEVPAPAVKKEKLQTLRNRKYLSFEGFDDDTLENDKLCSKTNVCQYHRECLWRNATLSKP